MSEIHEEDPNVLRTRTRKSRDGGYVRCIMTRDGGPLLEVSDGDHVVTVPTNAATIQNMGQWLKPPRRRQRRRSTRKDA